MAKETPSYVVILCGDCNFYFGKHKKSKFNCPRCGALQQNPQIFSRVDDSNKLHNLVSELNIPEELRNDFRDKNKNSLQKNNPDNLIDLIPLIINEVPNSKGELNLLDLNIFLKKNNIKLNARKIIETCEIEGLLLRLDGEKWKIISESL